MSPSAENGMKQILLHTHALHLRPCAGDVESPTSNGTWGMSPGVCTAPVPAPERDCPSEGCQLVVRKNRNYNCVKKQGVKKQSVEKHDVMHLDALFLDVLLLDAVALPRRL